jgi:hypothetical protein
MKTGTCAKIAAMTAALLVLASCQDAGEERRAPQAQPLDGGYPLQPSGGAEADRTMADDPCWRRERGGWHSSIGHCAEMLSAQPMAGVLVLGFEETSFFPGAASIPDPNDPRRYRFELEADFLRVRALAGRTRGGPPYQAYRIAFSGRRTRYPVFIDCSGSRGYVFIADHIREAHYLGAMPDPNADPPRPSDRRFVRSGEGGKIRQMEDEALATCFRR